MAAASKAWNNDSGFSMFIIIWEYLVLESHETEFQKIYGANGDWVQLFKRGQGYLGTKLFRDINHPGRYITIDRWIASSAFESFQEEYRLEYEALDGRCEFLTERETRSGAGHLLFST